MEQEIKKDPLEKFSEWLQKSAEEFDRRTVEHDRRTVEHDRLRKEFHEDLKEVKDIIKKNSEEFKKSSQDFDERLKKSSQDFDERLKKNSEEFKKESQEFWKRSNKISRDIKRTQKSVKEVSRQIGGIGNSNGHFAFDFFYKGLDASMKIGDHEFEDIQKHLHKHKKKTNLQGEYDMVMINTDTIIVIEVKYKLTKDYVKKFYNKGLKNFKTLFPQYSDYTLYGAVASMSDPDGANELAKKYGLYVLGQSGKNIKLINDQVRPYDPDVNTLQEIV